MCGELRKRPRREWCEGRVEVPKPATRRVRWSASRLGYCGRVSIDDPRLLISSLAEPAVLLEFGALVAATSLARPHDDFGHPMSPNAYITPFGLAKTTGLSRDVIDRAAERLVRAGLLKSCRMPSETTTVGVSTMPQHVR